MLNSEVFSHVIVTFVYFLLVSVFRFRFDLSLVWLWFGGILGMFFLDIDHLLYWFFYSPEKEDSKEAKTIWERKGLGGVREMGGLLERYHGTHHRLYFHSAVFQVVLLGLSIFVLTSGGSVLASAFIMSVNLHLLKDEWSDFFKNKEGLADWMFWQVRLNNPQNSLTGYLVVASAVFLFLSIFI